MSLFMVVLGNRASHVPEVYCAYADVGYPMWIGSGSIEKCFERIESICARNGWNLFRVKKYLEAYKRKAEYKTITDKRGNEERVPERYPKCEEYYLRQWEETYRYEFEDRINTIEDKLSTEKPRLKLPRVRSSSLINRCGNTTDSSSKKKSLPIKKEGAEKKTITDKGKKKPHIPRPKIRVRVKA